MRYCRSVKSTIQKGVSFGVGALGMAVLAATIVQAAETLRVRPIPHEDQVLVSFEVVDGFNDDIKDSIKSGLRTTFSYQVELRTVARLWLDRVIATAVVSTAIVTTT